MKFGGICSPISAPTSKKQRVESQMNTGLTGEFVTIKLNNSQNASLSLAGQHSNFGETTNNSLSNKQMSKLENLEMIEISNNLTSGGEKAAETENSDVENNKPTALNSETTDLNQPPPINFNRRRFEMQKCSSAHNILKAPVAFVNKNNARISLSPIENSMKRRMLLKRVSEQEHDKSSSSILNKTDPKEAEDVIDKEQQQLVSETNNVSITSIGNENNENNENNLLNNSTGSCFIKSKKAHSQNSSTDNEDEDGNGREEDEGEEEDFSILSNREHSCCDCCCCCGNLSINAKNKNRQKIGTHF